MKGMAPEEAFKGQKKPVENPEFLNSLICVDGTGRYISATGREKRRNRILIKTDGFANKPNHQFPHIFHYNYSWTPFNVRILGSGLNKPALEKSARN
jgi:hypothetical protein